MGKIATKSVCLNEQMLGKVSSFLSTLDKCSQQTNEYYIFPGFADVHVHFRQPGFSYKETILTGSQSASAGGYTTVFTMPNLNPVPDTKENILLQQEIIDRDACINVYPYGSITKGQRGEELADFEAIAPYAIAFSDDGRGVQNDEMMLMAMEKAKKLNKIIVAHCEVNSLLNGGYIHDGEYAKQHNHKGICSESEFLQIARDIELAKKTGCKYHVCHISCKESVDLIRQAKKDGVDITCETAPHYLVMDDSFLKEEGRFKMNPPLRSKKDKEALVEGIIDGTIDMIATDHAPHSFEEKSKGLEKSAFGIVGLETAFPVLYTYLVKENVAPLEQIIKLLSENPKKRFNVQDNGFSVWDLNQEFIVDPSKFKTMGKATPFENMKLNAQCILTVLNDKIVYKRD